MRLRNLFLATSLVLCFTACEMDTDEPSVVELRAKQKVPCGGFAGTPCADGQTCIDDPSDSCDPDNGGADCIGMCVKIHPGNGNGGSGGNGNSCNHSDQSKTYVADSLEQCAVIHFICAEGSHYFADDCGCGCELD
jgi:hypothetical protein